MTFFMEIWLFRGYYALITKLLRKHKQTRVKISVESWQSKMSDDSDSLSCGSDGDQEHNYYTCAFCEEDVYGQAALKEHVESMHLEDMFKFPCPTCGYEAIGLRYLRLHVKEVHDADDVLSVETVAEGTGTTDQMNWWAHLSTEELDRQMKRLRNSCIDSELAAALSTEVTPAAGPTPKARTGANAGRGVVDAKCSKCGDAFSSAKILELHTCDSKNERLSIFHRGGPDENWRRWGTNKNKRSNRWTDLTLRVAEQRQE
jgi:hypothetical protein